MKTISMILTSTLLAIAVGLPIGILMSRSDRVQGVVNPVLDVMQTMPSFVYLIPVVMLLGIGKVPGLIAVVIYAIPPMIRLTNLGIRQVDSEVLEAADAFGTSPAQKLFKVQTWWCWLYLFVQRKRYWKPSSHIWLRAPLSPMWVVPKAMW